MSRKQRASSKQPLVLQYLSSFNFGMLYFGSEMRSLQQLIAGRQKYRPTPEHRKNKWWPGCSELTMYHILVVF